MCMRISPSRTTPRGVPHAFVVVSATARLLCLHTPGCCQAFYWDASEPITMDNPAPPEQWTSRASRHPPRATEASTSSDHHRSTGKDYNEARIRSQDSAAIARGAKRLPRLAASKLAPPQHSRAQPAQLGPGNPPDNNARQVMKRASRRGPARACSRRVTPAGHQLPRNRGRSPTRIAAHFGAARGWPPTRGSHGVSVTGRSGRCPRRR